MRPFHETPDLSKLDHAAAERAWKAVSERILGVVGTTNQVVSPAVAFDSLPASTSPGYPFISMGINKKGDCRSLVLKEVRKKWSQVAAGAGWETLKVPPVSMSCRKVVREVGVNKPRPVWGYPAEMVTIEAQFGLRMFEKLQKASFTGWSLQWLDGGSWRSKVAPPPGTGAIFSSDFDSFDAHVAAPFIRRAFTIIADSLELNSEQREMFQLVVEYFIHTPFTWYGDVLVKHHGVPSGTYFTAIIDTIVNMFYTYYVNECQDRIKMIEHDRCGTWQGDDSRIMLAEGLSSDSFHHWWTSRYADVGAVVSARKCEYLVYAPGSDEKTEPVGKILSRTLYLGYPHLSFDAEKVYGQILIPEDGDKDPGDVLTRLIGLAWAYGWHRETHALLHDVWCFIKSQYPDCTPTMTAKVMLKTSYASGQLGRIDHFTAEFPSFETVSRRTFGYV